MPRLNMHIPHQLGKEETLRRLKEKLDIAKDAYQSRVSDLHQQWKGDELLFGFKVAGMKVTGTLSVENSAVKLAAALPFAAMMFKGKIERRLREELSGLLG